MTDPTIGRRDFIELAAVLLAAASMNDLAPPEPGCPATTLASVFGHVPGAAREIGSRYLQECPDQRNPETLVTRILDSDPDLPRRVEALRVSDLRARFRRRFAADFATGNTVQIEGWVLSRTESRLCALWAVV